MRERVQAFKKVHKLITPTVFIFPFQNFACILKKLQRKFGNKIGIKLIPNLKKIQLFIKMYYIVITKKKQRNVWSNFFESLYSFAHFKCKGYILY